jgi:hypothetical protein
VLHRPVETAPFSGHNGALGNGERAFVVINPASCAEQDDEAVARMGHQIRGELDVGHPSSHYRT